MITNRVTIGILVSIAAIWASVFGGGANSSHEAKLAASFPFVVTTILLPEPPIPEPASGVEAQAPPSEVVEAEVPSPPEPEPPKAPAPPPPPPRVVATGDVWEALRNCEAGGNYAINTGNGYYGAYQFLPSTWNAVAQRAGRPDLVGVLPSNASPADQDAMAQHLQSTNGWGPWPGCRAKLGLP